MNLTQFIFQKEFESFHIRLKELENEIQLNSYNLFTLSSYNPSLENFHSDILGILLNPIERHMQNHMFLGLFLDFLISHKAPINKNDYSSSEITREKGRIDIWIKDACSKKSIIIENKINNAIDQDDQLENYYKFAKKSGFEIDSIIYLTLNGIKNAPLTDFNEINNKIINISASNNTQNDLLNGWLKKCYEESYDENNRSFIFQYIKLIKHLSNMNTDKKISDEFYQVINKENGFEKIKAIVALTTKLESYRADLFFSKLKDNYQPFKKVYRYRPHHWLFENYNDNGIIFKLDVHFYPDGSARIDFWNPGQPQDDQTLNVSNKLQQIGLFDQFAYGGFGGGMLKTFTLKEYKNIDTIDQELYFFVQSFFEKLCF